MFAKICRRVIKFFTPGGLDASGPVNLQCFEYAVGEFTVYASLAQFRAYSNRTVAATDPVADIGFGETAVVLQSLVGEPIEFCPDVRLGETLARQLRRQFRARVFASRERGDRGFPDLPRLIVAQASASSADSSSSTSALGRAARSGSAIARTAASISAAISGFSFSAIRTLSLP